MESACAWQKIEGLKDETDFLVTDVSKFVVIEFADQTAGEPILARTWGIETANKIHQRGFAGARRAHDGDIFAFPNFHIDTTERMHLFRAHFVDFGELGGLNDQAVGHQVFAI